MSTTIQQIRFTEYGTPEVLEIVEVDRPEPGPGEVLIQVEAAGINYSDLMRRRNTYFMPTPLPYVPGVEAAGTIVAAGDGVDAPFVPGTRVLAILPYGGGYANYVTNSVQFCVPLPPQISAADATAIFVQGTTAQLMMTHLAGDVAGKTVLVHAAAGGVGSLLAQLAQRAGARVIGTVGSSTKFDAARAYGCDTVINYSQADWPEQIVAANDGEKLDLIFEMVGGNIFQRSFECLRTLGKMIVYGTAGSELGHVSSEDLINNGHSVAAFNLAYFIDERMTDWQESLGRITELLAAGDLKVSIGESYALSDAAAAHRCIEERRSTGKVVLVP